MSIFERLNGHEEGEEEEDEINTPHFVLPVNKEKSNMDQDDPFAELMLRSNQSQLRPLPLQRSQTVSICQRERCISEHENFPSAPRDLMDAPMDKSMDSRRRCSTLDAGASAPIMSANPTAVVDSSWSGPDSPLKHSNKVFNIITPEIIDCQHSNNLLIFEDESRVRTSTLESVMAVKSLNSDVVAGHMHRTPGGDNIGGSSVGNSYHVHHDVHKPLDVAHKAQPFHESYMEINDDKSDVSSLSDCEYHDFKLGSAQSGRGNSISALLKRPIKPLHPLRPNKPLKLRPEGPLAPLRPLRLRSGARSTETSTTEATHTLSTIDNFDVASPFSPLGALGGQEELSFLKSAYEENGYGSLHGYHRRCRTNAPGHMKSNSSDVSMFSRYGKKHPMIQSSWLVPSNTPDDDLIDMESYVNELNLISSYTVTNQYSTPSVEASACGSLGAESVDSGAFSSPMKSIQGMSTMSTAGDSEYSSKSKLKRPPVVSRSVTSPSVFKNDNHTSRLQRNNPTFSRSQQQQQRNRPSQITTGSIDSPCMIGSIAIAEAISPKAVSYPRRPSFTNYDCNSAASISINTKDGNGTPSLPSLEEDDENASFGSFDEELKRKHKAKMIGREVKQMFKTLDPKPVVNKGKRFLGLKVKDHELKRADGHLA